MAKNENAATAVQSPQQSIEQLQQRYQRLHTRKIQAETNLANATERLAELKKEAREKFGTDDISELRAKLQAMTDANDIARRQYQAELDRIEADVESVEEKFAVGETAGAKEIEP